MCLRSALPGLRLPPHACDATPAQLLLLTLQWSSEAGRGSWAHAPLWSSEVATVWELRLTCWDSHLRGPNSGTSDAPPKSLSAGRDSPRSQQQHSKTLRKPLLAAFRDLVPQLTWGTGDFSSPPCLASPEMSTPLQRTAAWGGEWGVSRRRTGRLERMRYTSFNKD